MTGQAEMGAGRTRTAFFLSFASFFVFPAIPLGETSAIAIPYVFGVVLSIAWLRRLEKSDWGPFACLMAPLAVSGGFVLATGVALAPDVVPKIVLVLAVTFAIVVPARHLVRAGYDEALILGAACAISLHAALGIYQTFAFAQGEFPFAAIMSTNPGMAMAPETIDTYVEYVRRPFGLFAEPSAMAACVGPWLVVVSAALFTPGIRERLGRHRRILAFALVSGFVLVVLSRSGQAVPIAVAVAVPPLAAALSSRRGNPGVYVALALALSATFGASWWLVSGPDSRFDVSENQSWQMRLASLGIAIQSMGEGGNVLFGVGPGQSVAQLGSSPLGWLVAEDVTAVWSVTLTYAMETGLIGVVCMLALARAMFRSVWRSSARAAGTACAAVWGLGLLFGTSYVQQPALWTAMAMLLSWDSLVGDDAEPAEALAPEVCS